MNDFGLIHIYTGNGKGKTTSAIGLGLRAVGAGKKVTLIQFLKATPSAEIDLLKSINGFNVIRANTNPKFYFQMTKAEKETADLEIKNTLSFAKKIIKTTDMLILDEIFAALSLNIIDENCVLDIMSTKPENTELILTGQNAPKSIIELSDYVSEIKKIKHPFDKGINARYGIEY